MKRNITENQLHTILHESINQVLNETHFWNNMKGAWNGFKNGYKTSKVKNQVKDNDYGNWMDDEDGELNNFYTNEELTSFDEDVVEAFTNIYEEVRNALNEYTSSSFFEDTDTDTVKKSFYYIKRYIRRIQHAYKDIEDWFDMNPKYKGLDEGHFFQNLNNGFKGAENGYHINNLKNTYTDRIANTKGKYDKEDTQAHKLHYAIVQGLENMLQTAANFLQEYKNATKNRAKIIDKYLTSISKMFTQIMTYRNQLDHYYFIYEDEEDY